MTFPIMSTCLPFCQEVRSCCDADEDSLFSPAMVTSLMKLSSMMKLCWMHHRQRPKMLSKISRINMLISATMEQRMSQSKATSTLCQSRNNSPFSISKMSHTCHSLKLLAWLFQNWIKWNFFNSRTTTNISYFSIEWQRNSCCMSSAR